MIDGLVVVRVDEHRDAEETVELVKRPLGIIHRRRKAFARAAQVFLELLRDAAA